MTPIRILGVTFGDGFFTSDGGALNHGVTYPNTVDRLGQENQFRKIATCPEDGVFAGKTYCATILGS